MIVVDLACTRGHAFEAWFPSASECDRQTAAGMVACPQCGTTGVSRTPSAAYLKSARSEAPAAAPADPAIVARQLAAALRAMAATAVDVGERFPEEARRIHYEQAERRQVRGKASRRELESLLDEGIAVLPVPDDDDLH